MARIDKRINVLVPQSRKAQYQRLANKLQVPLASLAATLMSLGYDTMLEQQETRIAQSRRRTATRS